MGVTHYWPTNVSHRCVRHSLASNCVGGPLVRQWRMSFTSERHFLLDVDFGCLMRLAPSGRLSYWCLRCFLLSRISGTIAPVAPLPRTGVDTFWSVIMILILIIGHAYLFVPSICGSLVQSIYSMIVDLISSTSGSF